MSEASNLKWVRSASPEISREQSRRGCEKKGECELSDDQHAAAFASLVVAPHPMAGLWPEYSPGLVSLNKSLLAKALTLVWRCTTARQEAWMDRHGRLQVDQVLKLHRVGISKSEITHGLKIGRTSVRRFQVRYFSKK